MSKIPDVDLRDIVKLNLKIIKFFGYLCPEYHQKKLRVLYYIYSLIFVGLIFGIYILTEIADVVLSFGDIEKLSEASFLCLTHLVHASKLYVFLTKTKKVWLLINSINQHQFKPKSKAQYEKIISDIKFSKRITLIFIIMGLIVCSLWAILPFIDEESIKLPGRYPFDYSKSPAFEIIYTYRNTAVFANAVTNISMDSFLSGLIMVVSGQLSILNISLQEFEHDRRKNSLVQNVLHYRNIIRFSEDFTELFTKCIMAQFIVSVIIICMAMFRMSLLPVFSLQFLSMILYQGCMILEIFLWCYFGNEVILKSQELTTSAFMSDWVAKSKNFKKDLLFFMTRSQIPLQLYAGGYFILSLDTFKAIVKSSWSYFAVLNRIHTDTS